MLPTQLSPMTRRGMLGLAAAIPLQAQLDSAPPAVPPKTTVPEPKRPPKQDPEMVASFVGLAHKDSNLDQVAALVLQNPRLVYAAWDWGGGDWETGLGGASHIGSRKIALFLLDKGARIDAFCAAMLGERAVVSALVAADPGVSKALGPHGYSLLYHAAISGDIQIAEMLRTHLAERPRDFNQALSAAVRGEHLDMTVWLLEHGVTNPNLPDGLGKRPLTIALQNDFRDIADVLRRHGAREMD